MTDHNARAALDGRPDEAELDGDGNFVASQRITQ